MQRPEDSLRGIPLPVFFFAAFRKKMSCDQLWSTRKASALAEPISYPRRPHYVRRDFGTQDVRRGRCYVRRRKRSTPKFISLKRPDGNEKFFFFPFLAQIDRSHEKLDRLAPSVGWGITIFFPRARPSTHPVRRFISRRFKTRQMTLGMMSNCTAKNAHHDSLIISKSI